MALITCPECGRKISDKAAACPSCGYPLAEYRNAPPEQAEAPPPPENKIPPTPEEPLAAFEHISGVKLDWRRTRSCPHCHKTIPTNAEVCPFCQCEVTPIFVFKESKEHELPVSAKKTSKKDPFFWVFISGLIIICILAVVASLNSKDQPTSKPSSSYSRATYSTPATGSGARHTDAEAFTCACAIVEGDLKAPSTAKFCKITEATITHLGDGEYMVTGWVDAENGFGAMIRSDFIVTYTATEKGYKNGSAIIG